VTFPFILLYCFLDHNVTVTNIYLMIYGAGYNTVAVFGLAPFPKNFWLSRACNSYYHYCISVILIRCFPRQRSWPDFVWLVIDFHVPPFSLMYASSFTSLFFTISSSTYFFTRLSCPLPLWPCISNFKVILERLISKHDHKIAHCLICHPIQ